MSMVRFTPGFDVDSAFDDLVRRSLGSAATWSPAADIHLEGPDAVITLEVPGVAAGGVEIEVKERSLIVRGKRVQHTSEDSDEQGRRTLRREIRRGEFSRAFRLPAHVTPDAVQASYDDGMLTIRVVGAQPAPISQRITIANLDAPQAESPAVEQG